MDINVYIIQPSQATWVAIESHIIYTMRLELRDRAVDVVHRSNLNEMGLNFFFVENKGCSQRR